MPAFPRIWRSPSPDVLLSPFVLRHCLEAVVDALFVRVCPHNHAVIINSKHCCASRSGDIDGDIFTPPQQEAVKWGIGKAVVNGADIREQPDDIASLVNPAWARTRDW